MDLGYLVLTNMACQQLRDDNLSRSWNEISAKRPGPGGALSYISKIITLGGQAQLFLSFCINLAMRDPTVALLPPNSVNRRYGAMVAPSLLIILPNQEVTTRQLPLPSGCPSN